MTLLYNTLTNVFVVCGCTALGGWCARLPGWRAYAALAGVMVLITLRWWSAP